MCGRAVMSSGAEMADAVGAVVVDDEVEALAPSYNVAPTRHVITVAPVHGVRRASVARWGLPRSGRGVTINARDDRLRANPVWRRLCRAGRVVVPLSGFYEWSGPRGQRQAWYFRRADRRPLLLAGLCERSAEPRAVVVTTSASSDVSEIHDRMPAILEPDVVEAWLESVVDAVDLLRPADAGVLVRVAVSSAVNDSRSDGPELIEPVRPRPQQAELF